MVHSVDSTYKTMIKAMHQYKSVYRSLGLPEALIDCALGHIQIPIIGWVAPSMSYGFPPALIPIASNGSGPNYLGYWKHWFSNRAPTFVKMYVGSGRIVVEIARTPAQFFCYLAMTAIAVDDGITPAVEEFADAVGITNLLELDSVSLKTGDNPLGFAVLPQFAIDLPVSCVSDFSQYTGDFPTGLFGDSYEWWHDSCAFEITREIFADWPKEVSQPQWIIPGNKIAVFDDFLGKGDLHGAWMTLNSSGWSIPEANTSLKKLADAANDPEFMRLASAWSSVADPLCGSY